MIEKVCETEEKRKTMISHNNQKKLAVINDISGFGRCSIAVSMPIISYMGIQCCPVPTSIFSNHTGFEQYFFDDYTDKMQAYTEQWKKLDLHFEGIMTGFLGSVRQIDIVRCFIEDFRDERTRIIIDPAMGENGKPYPTYTAQLCNEMRRLLQYADIVTPNVTESCILTNTDYKEEGWTIAELSDMAERLLHTGAKRAVISGVRMGECVGNVVAQRGREPILIQTEKIGAYRSGTGDVYAAVIAADCVNGISFPESVRKASDFVKLALEATDRLDIPPTDGLAFEEVLYTLKRD